MLGDIMASLKDFIELLRLYPLWIRIVVPLLIVAGIWLLVAFKPQFLHIAEDFELRPIQSTGENIFLLEDDSPYRSSDHFYVAVHFDFWSKHELEILNINLRSGPASSLPRRQRLSIDRASISMDASYRLTRKVPLKANGTINIELDRQFESALDTAKDYPHITVSIEASSPAWQGIRTLVFEGKLEPGGRLAIQAQTLHK